MKRRTNITKLLEELDKEDLIAEIEKLCAKFEVVRNYFEIELSGDASNHLEKAKKEVMKQFYTSAGAPRNNPKASKLNGIVKSFAQLSIYKEDMILLMLHRIFTTVDYARNTGGVSDALFGSTMRYVRTVMEMIEKEDMNDKFAAEMKRLQDLIYQADNYERF